MLLTRYPVAKERDSDRADSAPPPSTSPLRDGGDAADFDYEEPIKVPLDFKQRLERIAQHVSQKRKRSGRRKRALGWFVVTHMTDWMAEAEAMIEEEEKEKGQA